jgi:hypothetical protein
MRGYGLIIMFTDDHSKFIQLTFIKSKSETPVKFWEYVAKVEKQQPKSKLCRIRVPQRSNHPTRGKFLEYFAMEVIIRELSAQRSQH